MPSWHRVEPERVPQRVWSFSAVEIILTMEDCHFPIGSPSLVRQEFSEKSSKFESSSLQFNECYCVWFEIALSACPTAVEYVRLCERCFLNAIWALVFEQLWNPNTELCVTKKKTLLLRLCWRPLEQIDYQRRPTTITDDTDGSSPFTHTIDVATTAFTIRTYLLTKLNARQLLDCSDGQSRFNYFQRPFHFTVFFTIPYWTRNAAFGPILHVIIRIRRHRAT